MVEFANAIPDDQRRNGTWQRHVMRQGMTGLLPTEVHQRVDKASFNWSFSAAIADKEFGRVLESPRIAAAGWIDGRKVQTEWEAFHAGNSSYRTEFFTTAAVELWFREVLESAKSRNERAEVCA
jgi:hypothetical protein